MAVGGRLAGRPLGSSSLRTAFSLLRPRQQRRWLSRAHLAESRVQVYISQSRDPYLNLSIEHYLLQESHRDSAVLFIYTNRPSVVIGRNQNPWLEVNLGQLRRGLTTTDKDPSGGEKPSAGPPEKEGRGVDDLSAAADSDDVLLVRRRSGGGTVFHDEGNVNYCVIVPKAGFHRDTSAEMVARALTGLGIPGIRVSERHDIVMDVAADPRSTGEETEAATAAAPGGGPGGTFKISGSAFKITRDRALHHATCLLASPHLGPGGAMSRLLRSPAEPFVRARGVASVRSPVRNAGGDRRGFERAVVDEFCRRFPTVQGQQENEGEGESVLVIESVSEEEALARPQIVTGCRELMTRDWIFGQTPRFTFSTYPTEADERDRPPLPSNLPAEFKANLTVHQAEITEAHLEGLALSLSASGGNSDDVAADIPASPAAAAAAAAAEEGRLTGKSLLDVADWTQTLAAAAGGPEATNDARIDARIGAVGRWLNEMFGTEVMQRYRRAPPKEERKRAS